MIWVLTAGFGDGHNAAARGVAEGLLLRRPDEEIVVEDLVLRVHPVVGWAAMAAYRGVIVHFPALWRLAYRWIEGRPEAALQNPGQRQLARCMATELTRLKPRAIVSTYPLYASVLETLARAGYEVPPMLTVVTDSVTIHPTWVAGRSDWYAVPDAESKVVLTSLGVAEDRVAVTGFPVNLAYTKPVANGPDTPGLIYLPSTSGQHVAETLRRLEPLVANGLRLTVVMGRHAERLYQCVRAFEDRCRSANVKVYGWTDQLHVLLRQHDLAISKAGGAIIHELMAAATPVVIDYIVPGQEEGNAHEIVRAGGGVVCTSAEQTVEQVARLMAENAAQAREMKRKLSASSVPDAALKVADELLARLKTVG